MAKTAVLALESGEIFRGDGFGARGTRTGELVFGPSVTGFEQIVSDPALAGKIFLSAYPLAGNCGAGNCGANDLSAESGRVWAEGVVCRECCARPSSFSSVKSFGELLAEGGAPGIECVDTRMLVRRLRERGSVRAAISTEEMSDERALALAKDCRESGDILSRVSCKKIWRARTPHHTRTVALLDCGAKRSLVRALGALRCDAALLPADATACEIRALAPDALVISNGPAEPGGAQALVNTVRSLLGEIPIFGVGFGFALLALACGGDIHKLKYGFYGPRAVRKRESGRIISASFAASYGVERAALEGAGFEITHEDVVSGAAYGARNAALRCAGALFNPEGSPGPLDALANLEAFINTTGREG